MKTRTSRACALALVLSACAAPKTSVPPAPPPPEARLFPGEDHLADLRQLTFGGENAEAYWSFDGTKLVLQARVGDAQCDRIYTLDPNAASPALAPVSSGQGATTCSYF